MCAWCDLLQVVYRDPVRYKLQKTLTIAPEGVYSGQVCSKLRSSGSTAAAKAADAAANSRHRGNFS
jgi:hypothetical protein